MPLPLSYNELVPESLNRGKKLLYARGKARRSSQKIETLGLILGLILILLLIIVFTITRSWHHISWSAR
jgi:hypothetical protein